MAFTLMDLINKIKSTVQNAGKQNEPKKLTGQELLNQLLQTPVVPLVKQTTPANILQSIQGIGGQLQRTNVPTLPIPDNPVAPTSFLGNLPGRNTIKNTVQGAFPVTQLPEQVNAFAQSYGRTLQDPGKHKLETAMNVLPFVGFAKTKPIQQALRDRLALTGTPEEASAIYNEFADKVIKSGAKDDLQALRAALQKEMVSLVGTGNYKQDYAAIQSLKNDTQVGGIIRTIMDKVATIDKVLNKTKTAAEKIVNPEMRTMAEQTASRYLNPLKGLGQDVARKGYTWQEVTKMKPTEAINILANDDLADIIRNTPVTQKKGILDNFRTPEKVLQKFGLGEEMKNLRTHYEAYQTQVPKELTKIQEWMKRVPGKVSNENIFRFLDGEKNVALTPEEGKVAQEIRTYLNNWANKLELPPNKRVSDYITRLYSMGTVEQEFDEDIAKIIDPKVAKSIYDPFMEKRIGSRIDYLKDTWGALQAYTKRATRKVNLDPALKALADKAPDLELSQWNYIKKFTDRINMRPTQVDSEIDNTIKSIPGIGYKFGVRPTATLTRGMRQVIYRGTLGLNVSSALRNLTQGTNTYAELGERWTLKGYTDLMRNWKSPELEAVGVLKDSFIQDQNLSVYKKAIQGFDKTLMALFEGAEKINRGACYYGAKAKALAQGMEETKAIDYAKGVVRKTQFTFGSIDTPLILSSDLSKTLLQLQSYNLKQVEFLLDKVGQKQFGGLIRWVGSMLVLKKVLKDKLGMSLNLLPINYSLTPSLQIGEAMGQVVFGDQEAKAEGLANLKKSVNTIIPGGVQLNKTISGIKANIKGGSYTPAGNLRYPTSQDLPSQLRNAIFGQYSGPEGRKYLNQNTTPLSPKQTQQVQGNPAAYEMIMKKRQVDKLLSQIKALGKDTSLTQAKKVEKAQQLQAQIQKIISQ